jgi:hypothetical protein
MCATSSNGGAIASIEDAAFLLRIDEETLTEHINKLKSTGLLADGLLPHDWESRQYKSDSSKDRVRAYRERKKGEGEKDNCNENGNVTCNGYSNKDGGVTVTPQKRTETEEEKNNIPLTESPREVPIVDNSKIEAPPIPNDEDLNLFICIDVVGQRLGRKLHTKEQEAVADWFGKYPMRQALEIFDKELQKYRKKNPGKDPPATYFSPVLKGAFPQYQHSADGMISGLAGKMRV